MTNAATHTNEEELTTSRVARELKMSDGGVRLLADRGDLPCRRLSSGMRLFKAEDVARVRESRRERERHG